VSDELERIGQFRADEPPPSQAITESARANLMALIAAAPSTASPGPRSVSGQTTRPFGRRRHRGVRVVIALGAACAAALVVLALGTGSTSPTSAVAAVLQRLANVAETQSAVDAPRRGQYLYVDSVQANESLAVADGAQCTALVPERRQIWIRSDGAGRLLETTGQASFPTPQDRAVCERINAIPAAGTSDSWFAARCFELGLASKLPRGSFENPATLLREMRKIDGGPKGPREDFVHIGDFLRESDDSPALRAAIYRAAATIPGVRLLGPTTDHLGRRGIGIGYPGHGTISELIFDQRTSALLGEQTVSSATGRASEWAAYRTSKIVAGVPTRPPGPLTPPCVNYGGYNHTGAGGVSIETGAPVK
jgi:hypothetical protein